MPGYDGITNRILSLEQYRIHLGIQDPNDTSPFATVCITKQTDWTDDSLMERTYQHLLKSGLPAAAQMSVKALLQLPTYELKALYKAHMANAALENKDDETKKLAIMLKQLMLQETPK